MDYGSDLLSGRQERTVVPDQETLSHDYIGAADFQLKKAITIKSKEFVGSNDSIHSSAKDIVLQKPEMRRGSLTNVKNIGIGQESPQPAWINNSVVEMGMG